VKITLNPVFDIATGKLLSHDGVFHVEHVPILFDRSAQAQAKNNVTTANKTASGFGAEGSQISGTIIPGLERESTNPEGFTPQEVNDQLVAGGEAVGGANSGVTGEAALESARTRNAGGFANALDEASRIKSRQLARNALDVSGENARLKEQKRMFAQSKLSDIMQSDRANQLRAMGLSDEAIAQELAAGRQGWLQNTEGVINTITNAGKAAFPKGFQG